MVNTNLAQFNLEWLSCCICCTWVHSRFYRFLLHVSEEILAIVLYSLETASQEREM